MSWRHCPRCAERTVAFCEIIEAQASEELRLDQMEWAEFLATLSRTKLDRRTVEADATLVGHAVTYDDQDHLLLHRAKDPGEWLSLLNWDTGKWRQLEMKAAEGYLETSVICFLPFGNLVGMMRGSMSAPSHKSPETWRRGVKPFGDPSLIAWPLLSASELARLRTAEGANRVELRIGRSKTRELASKNGRLASFLHAAGEVYGDIDVTMIISILHGNTQAADRRALLRDLQDLEDVMPNVAEMARATLAGLDSSP
ncbi:MAG: hypothetical protein ACRDR6_13130 [Pseudonocardiaceae bacterium]